MMTEENVVLIVDDEPDMCWAMENVLKSSGYDPRKALSGQEALTLVKRHPFRSLFLDAKLPDMDGLELARRIRKVDPDLRIIMVSGYFYPHDVTIQQAFADGLISAFIAKPFRFHEILKALETHSSPGQEPLP